MASQRTLSSEFFLLIGVFEVLARPDSQDAKLEASFSKGGGNVMHLILDC